MGWVRRMEIVTGLGAIALGVAFWDVGGWHWVLIGVGVSRVLPIWGAAAILRKAERDPSVLAPARTPEERRARGRRAGVLVLVLLVLAGAVVGLAASGWGAALFMSLAVGLSGALGLLLYDRWSRGA